MITLTIIGCLIFVGLIVGFIFAFPIIDIAIAALIIGLIIWGIRKLVKWASGL